MKSSLRRSPLSNKASIRPLYYVKPNSKEGVLFFFTRLYANIFSIEEEEEKRKRSPDEVIAQEVGAQR